MVDSYLAPNQLLYKDVPKTYKTIAELVTNKLYIGWKNVARVVVDEPERLYSIRLVVPPQSTTGDLLGVYFVATGGRVGSSVQITSGDSVGFDPVINIKNVKIEDQKSHGQLTAPFPDNCFVGSCT